MPVVLHGNSGPFRRSNNYTHNHNNNNVLTTLCTSIRSKYHHRRVTSTLVIVVTLSLYLMGFFAVSYWRDVTTTVVSQSPLDNNKMILLSLPEKLPKNARSTLKQQQPQSSEPEQQQQPQKQEAEQQKIQQGKQQHQRESQQQESQQQQQQQQLPADAKLCNFDGHCPIGTTCVGHPLSNKGGVCQKYRPLTRSELLAPSPPSSTSTSNDDHIFDSCVQACRSELEWDEHYYYYDDIPDLNTIPKIHNTLRVPAISSSSSSSSSSTSDESPILGHRPPGCLLVFERVPGINTQLVQASTREAWLDVRRAQHMVRVDPLVEGDGDNYIRNVTFSPPAMAKSGVLWTALCYLPCKTDADCGGNNNNNNNDNNNNNHFRCYHNRGGNITGPADAMGVCDRNKDYWTQFNNASKTVLVTGANAGYWHGLVNFAAAARYWAPDNPLVVYNLGLTNDQIQTVRSWSNLMALEWQDGIPYPQQPHVIKLHVYAWKSLAINESVHKYHNMFWLDAGATFTGPIDGLEHYLQRHGIFLVRGQDVNMKVKSHPATYKYFRLDKETFVGGPHYAGGIQGHVLPSRYIETIVKPNAACAIDPACITPDGANLGNHRFDQTTLSILAYGRYQQVPHHTEFLAAYSWQLNLDLTQPSSMFMWTARQGCQFYANREKALLSKEQQEGEEETKTSKYN